MLCREILLRHGHTTPYVYDERSPRYAWAETVWINETSEINPSARACDAFIVGIGGDRGWIRSSISLRFLQLGLRPVDAISPAAYVAASASVGLGLQAMPHAVVSELASVGDWCILNTNSTVDHECVIGNGVHVMGGASVAGGVRIGNFSTIGTNATVLPDLTIGQNVYVGAGALVTRSVPDNVVVVGIPAQHFRDNTQSREAIVF